MINIVLLSILLPVIGIFFIGNIYTELYKDFNGGYINEKQYEDRVLYCSDMQRYDELDKNIDCLSWVLTKEGNDAIVQDMFKKNFK